MARAVLFVLGMLAAFATFGGIALMARGEVGIGMALFIGSMVLMSVLLMWGLHVDREAGLQTRQEPRGSSRRRALWGAAAVVSAGVIAFAVLRLSG